MQCHVKRHRADQAGSQASSPGIKHPVSSLLTNSVPVAVSHRVQLHGGIQQLQITVVCHLTSDIL